MKTTAKIFFIFCIIFFASPVIFAKEIAIKIRPAQKITTSNVNLQEGDLLNFVVVEDVFVNDKPYFTKGQKITGVLTSIEDNNYLSQPAKVYIENFKTTDAENKPVKLKGLIYKSGNEHEILCEFVFFEIIRGGEVQIKPEKDTFTIYFEENL